LWAAVLFVIVAAVAVVVVVDDGPTVRTVDTAPAGETTVTTGEGVLGPATVVLPDGRCWLVMPPSTTPEVC